jgi:hypothetical protein
MSEKIPLGHGRYLEPDEGPREGPLYKRIVRTKPIPNTRSGHRVQLECGHTVMTFGNLAHACGVVFCTQCRDKAAQA